MAVRTITFHASPPIASFTATVATLTDPGTNTDYNHRVIVGPASPSATGYQGEYLLQAAGIYRWHRNEPLASGASTPTTYAYRVLPDDPIFPTSIYTGA